MLIITNVYQRLTLCQVLCETLGLVAVKLTKKQICVCSWNLQPSGRRETLNK